MYSDILRYIKNYLLPGDQCNCVVLCLEEGCCQAEVEDGEATTGF